MSTITGTTVTAGITFGQGTYTSPLTITATGAVEAPSGNAIYAAPSYYNPSVSNYGTVAGGSGDYGPTGAAGGAGVALLSQAGSVENSGSITGGRGGSGGAAYFPVGF